MAVLYSSAIEIKLPITLCTPDILGLFKMFFIEDGSRLLLFIFSSK